MCALCVCVYRLVSVCTVSEYVNTCVHLCVCVCVWQGSLVSSCLQGHFHKVLGRSHSFHLIPKATFTAWKFAPYPKATLTKSQFSCREGIADLGNSISPSVTVPWFLREISEFLTGTEGTLQIPEGC